MFKQVLEEHYATHEVVPTKGCLEVLSFLKANGVKIALTTGFYRKIITIILKKLAWDGGFDKNYKGNKNSMI